MLVRQEEAARRDQLFALLENRLRGDGQRLTAPTAVLRLKAAVHAAANAEICLSALHELREALSSEVAARHELSIRCDALQAMLREDRRHGNGATHRLTAAALPGAPGGDALLAERNTFRERLAHVFSMRITPPALAVLQIGLGATEDATVGPQGKSNAQVLQIAGARMVSAVRSGDIVTRIDAQEFACIIFDLSSREQLTHLACKMLDLLSEPMQIDALGISICPSIGIAMSPEDGVTADELLETAGDTMRRARAQGSRYAFSDTGAEIWASQFSALQG